MFGLQAPPGESLYKLAEVSLPWGPVWEQVPRRIGNYEVLRALAYGGMAEVLLARASGAEGFSKKVVIKRVLPQHNENREFIDMFRDEARLTARLSHGNIVQVIEFGESEGRHYLVLEHVNGPSLASTLAALQAQNARLSVPEVAHIAGEIARALDYAHRKRSDDGTPLYIVHRDVNPSNILLSREGEVKLTDFGIARARERLSVTVTEGVLKGKVPYLAPETIQSSLYDARSDLFALGAVIYEMLVGERAFGGGAEVAILHRIIGEQLPPPSRRNPAVPPELDQMVMTLLEKEPTRRPARGLDVAELTRPFAGSGPQPAADLLAETLANFVPEQAPEPAQSATPVSPGRTPTPHGRPRVLVVEESRTVRTLLRTALEGRCEVTEAASGTEAVELIKKLQPDAVVSQRELKGLSGLELCRIARSFPALRDMPFILLAADVTGELLAESRAAGVQKVLPKALDSKTREDLLQEILGRVQPA